MALSLWVKSLQQKKKEWRNLKKRDAAYYSIRLMYLTTETKEMDDAFVEIYSLYTRNKYEWVEKLLLCNVTDTSRTQTISVSVDEWKGDSGRK